MRYTLFLLVFFISCPVIFAEEKKADTTVGEFEALPNDQQVALLTNMTIKAVEKIGQRNIDVALKIEDYFVTVPPGRKYSIGVHVLEQQIIQYYRIDPQGYTIQNALAKVISDFLAQDAAKNNPTTRPATTQPAEPKTGSAK